MIMHTHTRALSALFPWFFDPAAAVRENTQQWVKILFEGQFLFLCPYGRQYKLRIVYFYPIFIDDFVVFKEVLPENSVLIVSIQEQFVMKSRL